MNPTMYVITYHQFNHVAPRFHINTKPLDQRFLKGKGQYVYYLIDKEVPEILKNKPVILEYDLDKGLHEAGGKYFGEWSFLLAEEKLGFCQYPFFMVSSRFYEKNHWLHRDLNEEWDSLFGYLKKYRWGWLPSYDRPMRWIDLSWEKNYKNKVSRYKFFPFTDKTYKLTEEIFNINIPRDYRFASDLFCNYIGFNSRKELLEYVSFYRPLIDYFFNSKYQLKRSFSDYVTPTGNFRNEKSFTFIVELLSHLFFFKEKHSFFALHYDGYYLIDESRKKIENLEHFNVPFLKNAKRLLRWQWRRLKTEGCIAPLYNRVKS